MQTVRRTQIVISTAAVLIAAAVFAALMWASPSGDAGAKTFNVDGAYALTRDAYPTVDGTCKASEDHAALTEGADGSYMPSIQAGGWVGIYDSAGALLAKTTLEQPQWQSSDQTCRWRFSLANVPAGKGLYRLEFGQRRFGGEIAESQLKLQAVFVDDVPSS